MGSVLTLDTGSGDPLRVYITGDILYRRALTSIVRECGPIDTMVVHLGGTRILGMLVTTDDRRGRDSCAPSRRG